MTALGESLLLQALGWAVLNSLWQMALLWLVYQLIVSVFRNVKSHQKSTLATMVLFSGFAWFVFTFISIYLSVKPQNHLLISSSLIGVEGNQVLNSWLQTMLPVASLFYLLLLVMPGLNFIRNYRYVQVLRRYSISKADVNWRMFVRRVAAQMGIKKNVNIWVSELINSPVTIGFLKPIILVPVAAINNLTTQQLEAVLLHELAHIRRFDYLLNLIITFIRTILYFNPFVKLIITTIEREREKSCDEMVMQFQYDPHGYASALLLFQKGNYVQKQLAIAANGRKSDLLHRVERILGMEKKPILSFNRLAGMLAGLLCIIALNALIILGKPIVESKSFAFQNISNPFYLFLTGEKTDASQPLSPTEIFAAKPDEKNSSSSTVSVKLELKISKPGPDPLLEQELPQPPYYSYAAYSANPLLATQMQALPAGIINANYQFTEQPELKDYQEYRVENAVELTKKVLEEKEWKQIEKTIADAFTSPEKELLRDQYLKEIEHVNWKQLQTQLKLSYDKINWEQVGEQLNTAMVEIKLDSLTKAYTIMVNELNKVECMLEQKKASAVSVAPDSDLSLKKVKEEKVRTIHQLSRIKAARNKKIVHL